MGEPYWYMYDENNIKRLAILKDRIKFYEGYEGKLGGEIYAFHENEEIWKLLIQSPDFLQLDAGSIEDGKGGIALWIPKNAGPEPGVGVTAWVQPPTGSTNMAYTYFKMRHTGTSRSSMFSLDQLDFFLGTSEHYFILDDSGLGEGSPPPTEPTLKPDTNNWGFIGLSDKAMWRVFAQTVTQTSSRKHKRDITPVSGVRREFLLNKFESMQICEYKSDKPGDENTYIGIIAEDAPPEIIEDGCVKLGDYISLVASATQEIIRTNKYLEKEVATLKAEIKTLKTLVEKTNGDRKQDVF